MNLIKPLAETADTVTLSRHDYEALLDAREDRIDAAAFAAQDRLEATLGPEAARADFLPAALLDRLMAGEAPALVWRQHRGMTTAALAAAAGLAEAELAAIEAGGIPSTEALRAIATALRLPPENVYGG